MAASKLAQLRTMSVVVADTGDLEAVRRAKPVDCTTNPSLILKAAENPASAAIVDAAVAWGRTSALPRAAAVRAVCDRLAVDFGVELSKIVPGRVSTEIDADLSFDAPASVDKAREVIAAYRAHGVGRERILIKLAGTWEGIRAAEILQREGIDCNVTLVFGLAQAIACAQAGAFLISPFVGRILDWHVKAGKGPFDAETDPGVASVRGIYAHYKARGIKTVVMGASFRNAEQIEALAGCDRLTISPALLEALDARTGELPRKLVTPPALTAAPDAALSEAEFRRLLNDDAMATEKLAEGIRLFSADLGKLRDLIDKRL
ncbi:MAG: transaldolase [Azospirillum sp.]|nr:transaldolase [Azospirillum sp.]MCZ8124529.1 transaldolase [Magnetospirillum sp.]